MDPGGEWSIWQVLGAIVAGLGLGGLVAWYFSETLKQLLPTPRQTARWMKGRDVPPAPGTHFTVLIADLEGDADGSQTRHVEAALEEHKGLEVVRIGPGPRLADIGSRTERQLAAERQGRARLEQQNGDVLIFGEVAEANKRLRLRFLARQEGLQGHAGAYALEAAELPNDFGADFNAVLLAWVATSVAPATDQAGHYVVDLLKPAAGKLKHLSAHLPSGLDDDQRGSVWYSLGLAASALGEQTGERAWLDEAVHAYRASCEKWTRERIPLKWAMSQGNVGNVLARLGERDHGTAILRQAVGAHRAALEEFTRERAPLDWARTQSNLGFALTRLGERESGDESLAKAVTACCAALKEQTRDRVPLSWAKTQNNLGLALATLGAREGDTARLEQAVGAFRLALKVRTRERAPLGWARTQNNLGHALGLLSESETGTARLKETVQALRAALEVRTRDKVPLQWATTQINLGNALFRLGEREDGTARLDEAVAAYRAALEVLESAGAAFYVGMAQRNLARAEALLGERRRGSAAE